MKTSWEVRRNVIARSDGERQWDYAYQLLLRWTMELDTDVDKAVPATHPEEYDGHRTLCPGLNPRTTANAND